MTFDLKTHLKTLTELHGVSGYEQPIADYLKSEWSAWVDDFEYDGLGSLIAIKRANTGVENPLKIMLSAHMDEIGLMVAEIRNGYLRLARVTGIDTRTLQAKSVIVHGKRQLIGTVAAVPPHISASTGAGRKQYPKLEDQWVDLGLPAEEVSALVEVGDIVTMDAPMIELKGGLLAGKAMDDRASVAAVSHCLQLLQRRLHDCDVYAVASVQEEAGHFGAKTAAQKINPDLAIAIDVGFARQPGVTGDENIKLGQGVGVSLGPNFHPNWTKWIHDIADACDIPTHHDPLPGASGTDAWDIQVANQGIPTALLNVYIRNMHSPVETVSLKDIKRTGRLMAEVIATMTPETPQDIHWQTDVTEDED